MRRHLSIPFAITIVLVVTWLVFVPDSGTIPFEIGDTTIMVEITKTKEERGTGLGGRESLKKNRGMLYVFDFQSFYVFNMKDMFFPLDIIWINKDKKIVDVMENVEPDTYPDFSYVNDFLAQYVLEVNAGFFQKHDLKLGDFVKFSLENQG